MEKLTHYERKQQGSTEAHTHGQSYLVEATAELLGFNPAAT